MRILYVGKFDKPWATENYVTWALRQHGCEVVPCLRGPLDLYRHRPDVLLFSKHEPAWTRNMMRRANRMGIPTVAWIWDVYFGFRRHRPVQFHADLLFTTDGGHESNFRALGCNHRVLRQGIHAPEHVIYPPCYRADVAFVGGSKGHPSRKRLLRWLVRTYRGRYVRYTRTRGLELNKTLATTKIIVGDSYPVQNYWSNRIYEITGRGGFILHPTTVGLEDEFVDGQHYVAYERDNFDQLSALIQRYLGNDVARERIRQEGWRRCGDFTYSHRVAELLSHIRQFADMKTGDSPVFPGATPRAP